MARVVNPSTGGEVFGPSTGHTVTVTDAPAWARKIPPTAKAVAEGEVWVEIRPSFRGLEYDLGSYPSAWILEDAVPVPDHEDETDCPDPANCPGHRWLVDS